MRTTYSTPKIPKSSPPFQSMEEAAEPLGAFGDLLSLEREARKLGDPKLLRIAEKINDAHGRLLRGECVPASDVRELIGFICRNTELGVSEVVGA